MSFVLGLDLALEATGYAAFHDNGAHHVGRIVTPGDVPTVDRTLELEEEVRALLTAGPVAVVLELLPRTIRHAGVELGQVHGVIRRLLRLEYGGRVFDLPPSSLKKFATGHGGAGKDRMLVEAVRRLGYAGHHHDEADALWLAFSGAHLVDLPNDPPGRPPVPARQLEALTGALEVTPTREATA